MTSAWKYREKCLCVKCMNERNATQWVNPHLFENFRYACEICGNKRCPHHSDHALPCTNSNAPGQEGSFWK